ncbi:MAG: hypothetical protein R3E86_18520 [Pseudomonadales bacterium]
MSALRWGIAAAVALVLGSGTLRASAAAPSDAEAETAVATYNATVEDPDKVICRKIQQTGSHFKKRVCYKRREWDEMTRAAQDIMRARTQGGNAEPMH